MLDVIAPSPMQEKTDSTRTALLPIGVFSADNEDIG
jgi:hypothetical protein